MADDIYSRIESMDWRAPYVWRLKISSSEFVELEASVVAGEATARQKVVYLAEWYKRCYDGGAAKPAVDLDCQKLFEEAGIDQANLFKTESGNRTWQYSIYVLGGVAIRFEINKTSDKRFLKELCRIYYGEDGDLDRLDVADKSRAVAFRESVRTRGSIYEYLKTIFSLKDDELAGYDELERRFIDKVRTVNNEVLKSKFDIEWVMGFYPHWAYATRKLRLVLKPESLGGLNHEYLGYERVRQWEIVPETCNRLVVGVRFLLDGKEVVKPDFEHPVLDFANTGVNRGGFVAWYTGRYSRMIEAPVTRFDKVEIVVRGDDGGEHSVETFDVCEWMQVFRVPDGYHEWTSRNFAQRDSMLVCSEACTIEDSGGTNDICKKSFRIKGGATSDAYKWCVVSDKVKFKDEAGEERVLYNRQGTDKPDVRLHNDILRYHDGRVSYVEDRDGEVTEEMLPLVLSRGDVIMRHCEVRNGVEEVVFEECEKTEFFRGNRFVEWNDADKPDQGRTTLRLTVKGVTRKMIVYYLPIPIRRDCEGCRFIIGGETICDRIVRDGTPTNPVYCKSLGSDDAFVSLEFWRATKHKEIIRRGKVVEYIDDEMAHEISYILKDELKIQDFSESGYREYDCRNIGNLYSTADFSPGYKHLCEVLEDHERQRVGAKLDEKAPEWLWVNLAGDGSRLDGAKFLYWNYLADEEPKEVAHDFACKGVDIVFQSIKGFDGARVCAPHTGKATPFAYKSVRSRVDLVKCFEIAVTHGVYFFALFPFQQPDLDWKTLLYEPLRSRRGGKLNEADRRGLLRLAEEFGFDWQDKYGIMI